MQICFNAVAQVNDGASNAYVAVDGLVSISIPDISYEKKEDKAFSTSQLKQFMLGLGEYSDVPFTIDYTKAQHARFRALAGKACMMKVFLPDPDGAGASLPEVATITCLVNKVGGPKLERGNEMRFECSIVVNNITYADQTNNQT